MPWWKPEGNRPQGGKGTSDSRGFAMGVGVRVGRKSKPNTCASDGVIVEISPVSFSFVTKAGSKAVAQAAAKTHEPNGRSRFQREGIFDSAAEGPRAASRSCHETVNSSQQDFVWSTMSTAVKPPAQNS